MNTDARPIPTAEGINPSLVLVAIPTLNEEAHIEGCVRSLIGDDPRMRHVAIRVADGGSKDRTVPIVEELRREFPNVELIDNPKKLQAAAVNAVANAAGGAHKILVRCDAHSTYPPGFVLGVAARLMELEADSLVVPMDAKGTGCFQRAVAWIVDSPLGSGGSPHRGGKKSDWVDHGHHAGFWLARFLELGGYDETFSHNEDAEYDRRLKASGGRIYLDADLRISYTPRSGLVGLANQYWNYGRGRARNLIKHSAKPKLRQMVPVASLLTLTASLAVLGLGLLTGWSPLISLGGAAPAAYGALLLVVSLWTWWRRKSACGLYVGLVLLAIHNAWAAGYLRQVWFGKAKAGGKASNGPLEARAASSE